MKRSEIKRKPPLRASAEGLATASRLSVPVFRPRKCDARKGGCGDGFTPRRMGQEACSPLCAHRMVDHGKAKKAAEAAVADRKQTRAALEAMKGLKQLRAEAQTAFNAFIRARDRTAGHGCICCGAALDWHSTLPGGAVDAGHFVSRGSAPELAFDERNVNAQRKGCNRPGGTTRAKFTAGMVERWGAAVVAELEGPQALPHLKHDDYRRIRTEYRAKARALLKDMQ